MLNKFPHSPNPVNVFFLLQKQNQSLYTFHYFFYYFLTCHSQCFLIRFYRNKTNNVNYMKQVPIRERLIIFQFKVTCACFLLIISYYNVYKYLQNATKNKILFFVFFNKGFTQVVVLQRITAKKLISVTLSVTVTRSDKSAIYLQKLIFF